MKKVLILFGGNSFEHNVSCMSAKSILNNIDNTKYDVTAALIDKNNKWYIYKGDIDNIEKWYSEYIVEIENIVEFIKQFDIVIGNITDRLDSPGRGPNGTGGLLLVNSSPRGRTFFNEVCRWGIEGGKKQRPNWETFYVSRWDNPYFANLRNKVYDERIDKWVDRGDDPYLADKRTYEEDLMLSRSDRQYREDILGLPSDDAGAQFPNFREQAVIDKPSLPKEELKKYIRDIKTPKPYCTYSIGFDPAKQLDRSLYLCLL